MGALAIVLAVLFLLLGAVEVATATPTVELTVSPASGEVPLTITIDIACSDPDGEVTAWGWLDVVKERLRCRKWSMLSVEERRPRSAGHAGDKGAGCGGDGKKEFWKHMYALCS